MEEKSKTKSKNVMSNRVRRIVLSAFSFFLFYLISFIIDPYADYWQSYFKQSTSYIVIEWVSTFIFCFLISESSIFIHTRLNRRLPWTEGPLKRLLAETFLNLLIVLVLILINLYINYLLYNDNMEKDILSIEEIRGILQWIIVSVIISLMIMSINTGSYLIRNWINTETKVAEHKLKESELRQASVEAELNALTLQLDPHFIFNNLSVLSELILENQQLGYQYSENFSKVYRFLLVNSKKNMISLDEELKFLNSYIFLIKQRIRDGVSFDVEIMNESKQLYIPPLTLQLLIENALKHNKTSRHTPLKIKISNIARNVIMVENNLVLIEKPVSSYSTGIGLKNIMSRFELLSKKLPKVIKDESSFKVLIYLMEYDK